MLTSRLKKADCNCPPTEPPPVVTPPPTEPPPGSEMLLRTGPGATFTNLARKPVKLFMAVQCCDSVPGVPNSRWPAISTDAMDYFSQYGANMFGMRLGPFFARCTDENNPECGETEFAPPSGPGGAYLEDGSFNDSFFTEIESLVSYARTRGHWIELAIVDTWYCGNAQRGRVQMPWPRTAINACGRTPGDPDQLAYVTKVVKQLNKYDNLIWVLDVEGDVQVAGANQAWWTWMIQTIRAAEKASGSVNVHMIGSNPTFLAGADYAYTHARAGLVQPIQGLPTINSERNPSFTPGQEISNFKAALEKGLVYAYWRDDSSEAASVQTLNGFKAVYDGTTPPHVGCYAPDGEDPLWDPNPQPGAGGLDASKENTAVRSAEAAIGDVCGQDAPTSLETLAQHLRDAGFCASKNNDSVFVMHGATKYGFEYHSVSYGNGCWTGRVQPKNTWLYLGPL